MSLEVVIVLIAVLAEIPIAARWAMSYRMTPRAIDQMLDGVSVGPFGEHLEGAAAFIRKCSWSHIWGAARAAAMVHLMSGMLVEVRWLSVGVLVVTLIPLFLGGEYSYFRARRALEDADEINRFLKGSPLTRVKE